VQFVAPHEAAAVAHARDGVEQGQGLGLVVLGGVEQRAFEGLEPGIILGDAHEVDRDVLRHGGSVNACSAALAGGFLGQRRADLGQVIRAVGRWDRRQAG
jgi:hypothetical protein